MGDYHGHKGQLADMIRAYDYRQMKINAYLMPDCVGGWRNLTQEASNWCLYYDPRQRLICSLAKPGSGARDSFWACRLDEVRRRVLAGEIPWKTTTKYARRILGLYEDEKRIIKWRRA